MVDIKSGLSAVSEIPFLGSDPEYAAKLKSVKAAEGVLADMLRKRTEEPNLSPSMLAAAGEFFDPGRTGSFGESLGRAAKGYSAAKQMENKQAAENAMMRYQMERMGLESAQTGAALKMLPQAGAPTPGAAGAAGGEGGGPTINIRGTPVNPTFIRNMMIANPKLGEALKAEYEMNLAAVTTQPGFILNKLSGQVTPVTAPGGPDVEIRFPEKTTDKGTPTLLGSQEDLIKLREARNKNDLPTIDRIFNKLQFGATAAPAADAGAAGAAPAVGAPRAPASTVQQAKATEAQTQSSSAETGKVQAVDSQKFLETEPTSRESKFTALRIIKNAAENPQMYGLLKKPGIGYALASFAKEKGETAADASKAMFTKENLEDFLRKSNFDTKDVDLLAVSQMASDLARLHFNFRKTMLVGQGSVSNMEDSGVAKVIGSTSDPAAQLISMAQLTGRRNDFDLDVMKGLRAYRKSDGANKTLEEFKGTPAYDKLVNGYEGWLSKTFNLGETAPSTSAPTSGGATRVNPFKAEEERRAKANKK
jgi:hypothetical protein